MRIILGQPLKTPRAWSALGPGAGPRALGRAARPVARRGARGDPRGERRAARRHPRAAAAARLAAQRHLRQRGGRVGAGRSGEPSAAARDFAQRRRRLRELLCRGGYRAWWHQAQGLVAGPREWHFDSPRGGASHALGTLLVARCVFGAGPGRWLLGTRRSLLEARGRGAGLRVRGSDLRGALWRRAMMTTGRRSPSATFVRALRHPLHRCRAACIRR